VNRVNEVARYVAERLLSGGLVVQMYKSYSTNSIYLKLDYGVMNSIRISDHKGKKHLKYRYNLLRDRKSVNKHFDDEYPRFYYGFNHVERMLADIFQYKVERLTRYGSENYRNYMVRNLRNNKFNRGFWTKSKELV